jgi:hypothetical protein
MLSAADHSVHAARVGTPASRALARSIAADEAAVRQDARRRLLQAGIESEAFGRERSRVATLLPTSSAAAAVALLLLQLFLGQGSLG